MFRLVFKSIKLLHRYGGAPPRAILN